MLKIRLLSDFINEEDKHINQINKIAHTLKFRRVGGYLFQIDTTLKKYPPIE